MISTSDDGDLTTEPWRPWSWLADVVDLVLPRTCVGCTAAGTWWCKRCARVLERAPAWLDVSSTGLRCVGVAPYAGPVGAAIVAHKERGVRDLATPMSAALARAVAVAAPGTDPIAIVPVPSRPDAVRSRAADVLAALSRRTAAVLRDDGRDARAVPALRHARNVVDQAGLDGPARHANVAGAFTLRRGAASLLAGRRVVVVDDVVTTGASLGEAIRALDPVAAPRDGGIPAAVLAWAGGIAPTR